MQLKENGLKKFKSKLMVETWPHVQPFHWDGSVCNIGRLLYWKKK